jgi:hypothetical protein
LEASGHEQHSQTHQDGSYSFVVTFERIIDRVGRVVRMGHDKRSKRVSRATANAMARSGFMPIVVLMLTFTHRSIVHGPDAFRTMRVSRN